MNNILQSDAMMKVYKYLFIMIVLGIIFKILNLYLEKYLKKRKSKTDNTSQREKADDFPYCKRDFLLTLNEQEMYIKLLKLCQEFDLQLFSKIRLADIIQLDNSVTYKMRNAYFNKIAYKHIDFIVCKNFNPIMFIELDDDSHQREDRKSRDKFVDNAMKAANYSIFHCPNSNDLQIELIKDELKAKTTVQ